MLLLFGLQMSNLKLKIIDSNSKIEKSILGISEAEIKNIFQKAKTKIHAKIINLIIKALSDSPEIISLQSGSLKYDFGLDFDPTQEIIYAVANSTYVYFKNFRFNKNSVTNILSVYIQPEDFRNLLSSGSAQVITSDGVVIPWLSWLLTAGNAVVVTQYHVDYGSYNTSRSGGAIMKPGGFFKVDSEFSGTVDDNFITRAIKGYESQITDIIRTSL